MKGHKVGYVRVSSIDQNIGRQLEGIEVDRLFVDKASGKNTARPKFQEMLSYVREGDMIVVHSMDRFARSLKDLVTEVDQLVKRGVAIQFVKENITFTAQATPMDNLMLQLADYWINQPLIPVSSLPVTSIARRPLSIETRYFTHWVY